ncbi:MAG: NUDIX domain-containing protein [Treponema sp.]|jgi:8-oxo-dGTP diphosphatase|nr:NUDIX domain-containing protein [Treponema sp.]
MERKRRSVAGIAVKDGRLFIARRKPGGELGGKWEFPGGKAEEGESDEAALLREYAEEFGLSIRTGPLLAGASFTHKGLVFGLNAYRIFFEEGEPRENTRLSEHTEWRWAALGEIERLDFAGSDRGLFPGLEMYLKHEAGIKE